MALLCSWVSCVIPTMAENNSAAKTRQPVLFRIIVTVSFHDQRYHAKHATMCHIVRSLLRFWGGSAMGSATGSLRGWSLCVSLILLRKLLMAPRFRACHRISGGLRGSAAVNIGKPLYISTLR